MSWESRFPAKGSCWDSARRRCEKVASLAHPALTGMLIRSMIMLFHARATSAPGGDRTQHIHRSVLHRHGGRARCPPSAAPCGRHRVRQHGLAAPSRWSLLLRSARISQVEDWSSPMTTGVVVLSLLVRASPWRRSFGASSSTASRRDSRATTSRRTTCGRRIIARSHARYSVPDRGTGPIGTHHRATQRCNERTTICASTPCRRRAAFHQRDRVARTHTSERRVSHRVPPRARRFGEAHSIKSGRAPCRCVDDASRPQDCAQGVAGRRTATTGREPR